MASQASAAAKAKTEVPEPELVDDDVETCSGTNISDSSEQLLPLGHTFTVQIKEPNTKEQSRRFSAPTNVFPDNRSRNRERISKTPSLTDSEDQLDDGSTDSLQQNESDFEPERRLGRKGLTNSERLLPNSSITSITTDQQASRLHSVLREGGRLLRQQTFPPLDHDYSEKRLTEGMLIVKMFKKNDFDKTDNDDACEDKKVDATESTGDVVKENLDPLIPKYTQDRRESAPVGSQLRDNITSVNMNALANEHLLQRRKSAPTDTSNYGEYIFPYFFTHNITVFLFFIDFFIAIIFILLYLS